MASAVPHATRSARRHCTPRAGVPAEARRGAVRKPRGAMQRPPSACISAARAGSGSRTARCTSASGTPGRTLRCSHAHARPAAACLAVPARMSARGAALSRDAASRLVASLRPLTPADVGSAAWWQQRRCVERLNSGAHAADGAGDDAACAASVAAAFAESPDKLDCLVQELLLAEAWRERVAPHLGACRAQRVAAFGLRLCCLLRLSLTRRLASLRRSERGERAAAVLVFCAVPRGGVRQPAGAPGAARGPVRRRRGGCAVGAGRLCTALGAPFAALRLP